MLSFEGCDRIGDFLLRTEGTELGNRSRIRATEGNLMILMKISSETDGTEGIKGQFMQPFRELGAHPQSPLLPTLLECFEWMISEELSSQLIF